MDFKFLYENANIDSKGRINERYFVEGDSGYEYTDFYKYKMANAAKSFFSNLVITLDERDPNTGKGKYTYDKEGDYIDYEATKKEKGPYAEKFLLLDEKWQQYKEEHENEFDVQERIDNTDSEEIQMSEFNPQVVCSLEEAIEAYWCAGELLKKYGKGEDGYDTLPKLTAMVSKAEFKDKHTNIQSQYRKELGIPEEDTFKVYMHEIRPRMKGGRHPEPTDDSKFEEYSNEFAEFLTLE